jgi:nicotinamide-nucleotide amidase
MQIETLAARLGACLLERGLRVACAESCTGGWIAKLLTDIPGSSAWFERGVVCYSNRSKSDLLGVPETLLDSAGAVSQAVVTALAANLLSSSQADLVVAVSGIAGPGGGTQDKPVGTVWIAWDGPRRLQACFRFDGDRDAVRRQAVAGALRGLLELAEGA